MSCNSYDCSITQTSEILSSQTDGWTFYIYLLIELFIYPTGFSAEGFMFRSWSEIVSDHDTKINMFDCFTLKLYYEF